MSADHFVCRCVLCHDDGDRDDADRMDRDIRENITRYGWHVVMVPADDIGPSFA